MANAPIGQKDRPWRARVSFRNGEASLAITQGMPVILLSTDPSAVITPVTGAADALNHGLFIGLSAENSQSPAHYGEVVVGGYHAKARILRLTKAASTDIWASHVAIAIGDYFTIDSVNNALARSGAGAAIGNQQRIVALEGLVSQTTRASDYFSSLVPLSATALIWPMRVWLHHLA